jgi:uncharacterized membrane protein YdbT with pleckstrin-like domain
MTVKLSRWGYLFSIGTKRRLAFWIVFFAYAVYGVITSEEPDTMGIFLLIALILVIETAALLYFPVTSFTVREGEIEYYDKINVGFSNNSKYEKMGFLIKDVKSIKIESGVIEKLFGFANIEIEGKAVGASGFDTYRIPKRKYHVFYGVRNPDELYAELLKFFPSDIVKDNTIWR